MSSIKDFQVISKLGEGAYSSVYKVKRIADGNEYALKKVKLLNLSEKEKQNALNEVRILASIRHPNIVGYREVFIEETTNSLCIVMEFVNNGDLYQKIIDHQKKGAGFTENELWVIFIQIVKGLKALHDLQILHRDLKSANVFLNKDNTVKLGDMNVSKVAKKGLLYTQTGTPYYASPEVWKDQPYDYKSDMWSLGCVLYEMATLKPPFRAENMEGLYKKVIRGYYPRIPNHYSQDLNNVIRALLQIAPHLRPNCDKILQFPALIKRMEDKYFTELDEAGSNFLLNTIRIPKNIHYLTDRLPKPNYVPLKTKKLDKKRFLQTLAGYQENDSQHESDNIRNSMPEIPYHLPKLKNENSSNHDKDEIILTRKKKEEDRDSSINQRLNDLLEIKKNMNNDLRKILEAKNNNVSGDNNDNSSLLSIQKSQKHKKNKKSEFSPSVIRNNDKSSLIDLKEDYKLPMILNNNLSNKALNIEGNRISNIIKNNINDLVMVKNSERNNKIKELTKLYRVQKNQYKKEKQLGSRNVSLPNNIIMPEIKQMS